ncbi:hypothetical protein DLREEDagrD3_21720 [Denitratisoma sp. agr-D3]
MMEFIQQPATEGSGSVLIDGDMTIYDALAIKQHLITAARSNDSLNLDLSQVGAMDTAGVQLLIMAHKECQRQDKPFRITALSEAVSEIVGFYNLEALLGIDNPAHGTTA